MYCTSYTMGAISDLSCYCFSNWVMLYFRTLSPCIHKVYSSERKGKGPRRWTRRKGHTRRSLTAVKMPRQEQRNCIVQRHRRFNIFLEPVIFLFEFTCTALKPFPHTSPLWLVSIRSETRGLFLQTRRRESDTERG